MASRSLLRPLLRASREQPSLSARLSTTASLLAAPPPPGPKPPYQANAPSPSPPPPAVAPESPDFNPDAYDPKGPKIDLAAAKLLASSTPYPSAPPTEIDWTRSYHGLSEKAFPKEVADILSQPLAPTDVEVKPDGILYLPEIKYRSILNAAFGPGGWGLVPKGEAVVGERIVTREYALIVDGRFISQAQGENQYFSLESLPSAVEGCKSNALMRCCKDLGVASELWDPVYLRKYRKAHVEQVWVEHVTTKKKKLLWTKKGDPIVYPYKKT